jgi:phage/plasmid primase-like uncharacterized protein
VTINWDQIRQEYPIATIIGQAIKLQKTGREWKGCCPFHAEKTPSFHVIPDKDFAHCFGCGWHGDVVDFIEQYQKVSRMEAVRMLTGGGELQGQTAEEKAQREAVLHQREQEEKRQRSAAIKQARAIWEAADPVDPHHPYLVRKNVAPHSCRQLATGEMLLPIHDNEGEVMSVQTIADDGGKRFHFRAPTKGGRFNIGINMGRAIVCEGYATGATIHEALAEQVCVAFSGGNMDSVARQLHEAGVSVVLAPDTGLSAEKAAILGNELNVPVIYPDASIEGTDFNDQAAELGIESVSKAFRNGLREFARNAEAYAKAIEEPVGPLDLWDGPKAPPFPRGVLPAIIEQFALESAAQIGTDPAGLAISALAACSAVLDDAIRLKPKQHENYMESGRIWAMLIGPPSARKSPTINRAVSRIKKMDARLLAEANRKLADWQEDGGNKGGSAKPLCPRLRIEDATTEAAQEVCRESPAGILVLQDELSGFFGRIEKYGGKGGSADRSFWLQAYGGGQYAVNRVGRGSFLIDNLSVTMLGGIQPEKIREVMRGAGDDGLIQRFIPIVVGKAGRDRDVPAPPVAEQFGDMLEELHALKAPANFFGVQPLTFADEARLIREAMADKHHAFVNNFEGANTKLSTHVGKYDGLFVRLCVIWHCVENVSADELPCEVSEETAGKVARFMAEFILPHALAFYIGTVDLNENDSIIRDVGGSILTHKLERVTINEMRRKVRSMRNATPPERDEAMGLLEAYGWLARDDKRHDAQGWKVVPEVHVKFADRANSERTRRTEIRKIILQNAAALDD